LAAALEERYPGIEIELIESGGGRFEVTVDGRRIYSKKATGRHPTHEEIFAAIG